MNCSFSCDKDKEVFNKIFQYNLRLLCGNNQDKINIIGNKICNAINTVKIVPNGPNKYLDSKRLNGEATSTGIGISDIYMKGFSNAPEFKFNQIKHTFSYELWHAIYAIMNRDKDGFDTKGNRRIWISKINGKKYFGYKPKEIQTDNGIEFTYNQAKIKKIHPVEEALKKLGIKHHKIQPRTPEHNGKVERSHRNDNERFYSYLKFYSIDDLREQGQRYLKRSNNIPMAVLGYLTPQEKRTELEQTGKIEYAI